MSIRIVNSIWAILVLFVTTCATLLAQERKEIGAPVADSPNQKIEQALASPVDFNFKDATFGDVRSFLEKKYDISVYIDRKALDDANVSLDDKLTLRVKGISLRSALRLFLDESYLKVFAKEGLLWVTTKDVADDLTETRAYPVFDLITRPSTDPWDNPQPDFNSLIDLIANTVRPDSWPAGSGPAPIERMSNAGAILILQTAEIHDVIAEMLAMLRHVRDQQMTGGKLKPIADRSWLPVFPKSTAAPAIRKALAERFNFDYEQVPLTDIVDFIANKWDIPVLLDRKALTDANVALDTPLTLTAKGCTLGAGLGLLLQPHDLTWIITHEVLFITTKDIADDTTSLRMYPISDLDDWDAERRDGLRYRYPNALIDAIHFCASPDSWTATGGPGAMEYYPYSRALVVTQTEKVHKEIESLLASARQVKAQQIQNRPELPPPDGNDDTLHLKVYRVMPLSQLHPGMGMGGMGMGGMGGGMFAVADETKPSDKPKSQPAPPNPPANAPLPSTAPQPAPIPMFDPTDQLLEIIPQVIEPASWKDAGGKGTIHALPGRLIVLQTGRVHQQIAKLLRDLQ